MADHTAPPFILDLGWDCFMPSQENGTDRNVSSNCMTFPTSDEDFYPPEYRNPSYYSLKYQVVGTIFQGIVLMVGLLGNVLVVLVVTRTRSMHTPTNCYLVSLSVADFMTLVASVPNEILAYYLLGDEWVWGRSGCVLFIFFQFLGINVSSLSITAFTVERYIAICHPMRAQVVCTVSRAKRIIAGAWLFACAYCSPWLFLTTTKPLLYKGQKDVETCTFKLTRKDYLGYFFADFILFYVFPLLLSCVLYGLIARVLFSRDLQQSNKTPKSNGLIEAQQQDAKRTTNGTNARVQVVKMLAVVVAVFATLWLPYRVLVVYNSFAGSRYMELWFLMFCKTMIFINSAINPILYNVMSVKFRRAFKRMLSCGRLKPRCPKSRGPYVSVAGSVARRQHHTVTSQVTSCAATTVEPLQQLL